jgi:hypothetical protein
MRRSEPPSLATWILDHAVPGGRDEGLAGDLLEEFRSGRSEGWYWRQVCSVAVIGFREPAVRRSRSPEPAQVRRDYRDDATGREPCADWAEDRDSGVSVDSAVSLDPYAARRRLPLSR